MITSRTVKLTSEFNKDFNKYKVDDNEYPNAQRTLESIVDLILVNPSEETSLHSLIVSNVLNDIKTVETLEQALKFKSKYAIIVENDAEFSETLFIEMLIKHNKEEKPISTGDIHLLQLGNILDNCITDDSLKQFSLRFFGNLWAPS